MRGTVVNTPGYYYAISYWLSALVMILVQGRGKKRPVEISVRGAELYQYFYSYVFYRWNKADVLHASYDMRFLLMLLYIKMAGELPWRETGFFCAKAFINAEFAASLCWQIHYFYTGDFSGQEKGTPEQMLWRVLHMVVIYAVLYILIYLIERYLKKDIEGAADHPQRTTGCIFCADYGVLHQQCKLCGCKKYFQCRNSYGCVYYPYTGGSQRYGGALCLSHSGKRDPDAF